VLEPPSIQVLHPRVTGLPLATEPLKPPTYWLASHHVCFGSPISHQATIQPDHQPPGPQICHLPPHQTPDPLTHRCQTTKSHRPPGARVMATRPTRPITTQTPGSHGHRLATCHFTTYHQVPRCQGAKVPRCQGAKVPKPPPPKYWITRHHLHRLTRPPEPPTHQTHRGSIHRSQSHRPPTCHLTPSHLIHHLTSQLGHQGYGSQTTEPPTHQTTGATGANGV
jgi:hypothetical protein